MSRWIKHNFKEKMWGCDKRTDNRYARKQMENKILGNTSMKRGQSGEKFLDE